MDAKSNAIRSKLVIAVFIIIIGGFFVLSRIVSVPVILESERRALAKLPALSMRSVASGEFMDKFENFAADSFPFRESFRTIRAASVFGLFLQTDKNGLYFDDAGVGEFKPINQASVKQTSEKIKVITDNLTGVNIYYSFIPDKSFYSIKKMPGFDPALTEHLLTQNSIMDKFTFINLTDALKKDSFYRTDFHWNQTMIKGVLDTLGAAMDFDCDLSKYSEEYAGEFHGVYTGQIALPIKAESLNYLSNPSLTALRLNVNTMEMEAIPVYDLEKFKGLDAYDIFLSGAQPLIILENESAVTDKELYLFRDSFSSSLAPLLASGYSKVVLIDLRYMDMRTLNKLVDFKPESDALFLYSTLVLNNSDMLLVR